MRNFNPYEMNKFCDSLGLKLIVTDNTEVYKILQIQQKVSQAQALEAQLH